VSSRTGEQLKDQLTLIIEIRALKTQSPAVYCSPVQENL
jgi:hypothetical protein